MCLHYWTFEQRFRFFDRDHHLYINFMIFIKRTLVIWIFFVCKLNPISQQDRDESPLQAFENDEVLRGRKIHDRDSYLSYDRMICLWINWCLKYIFNECSEYIYIYLYIYIYIYTHIHRHPYIYIYIYQNTKRSVYCQYG